jgi:hypothetical protein
MNPHNALISALIAEARKDDGDDNAKRARMAALLGAGSANPMLGYLAARQAAEAAQPVTMPRPPEVDQATALRAELVATTAALRAAQARVVALEAELAACRARRGWR